METILLPARVDQLALINQNLEHILTGKLEQQLLRTQLVVEELLTNICKYAYSGNGGEVYFACGEVNFDGKSAIFIQFTDNGLEYDPFLNYVEPDLQSSVEERDIGGLGIHLVKEIASHYAYCRIDNRNQTQIIIEIDS